MGVKKSTVLTMARSGRSWNTPAVVGRLGAYQQFSGFEFGKPVQDLHQIGGARAWQLNPRP